ncbi:MAG: hypothetical protein QXI19_04450, partial [Candidatus Caldarchaeum sp.]
MIYPSYEEFRRLLSRGNLVPVWAEVLADFDTPVSALKKIETGDYSFLLESVAGGEKWGRYSFLGTEPSVVFRSKGRRIEISSCGEWKTMEGDPLRCLRELLSRYKPSLPEGLPRFYGGAVGYFGYDIVRFIEDLPDQTVDDLGVWDSFFLIADTVLVFDNVTHKIKIISNAFVDECGDPGEAYERSKQKIFSIIDRLRKPLPGFLFKPIGGGGACGEHTTLTSNFSKDEFVKAVEKTKEYIRAGDIIQAVISQRWSCV